MRSKSPRRHGFTLIELIIGMGAATLLLAGLASAVLVASRSFDGSSNPTYQKTLAAEIQAEIMADITQALAFSERTAIACTFTVPDRNGDAIPETLRYAWSGVAGDPLTYSYNDGTTETIAEDVHDFSLNYLTRFMSASSDGSVFGYDAAFSNAVGLVGQKQIATQATLSVDATLTAITAYVGGTKTIYKVPVDSTLSVDATVSANATLTTTTDVLVVANIKDYRFAIYTDNSGEPGKLIVESATASLPDANSTWLTISVPPTLLSAGTYWLALAMDDNTHLYYQEAGGTTRYKSYDAVANGYLASWGTSDTSLKYKVSIYGQYTPVP